LTFTPSTRQGWRGPYLSFSGKYPYTAAAVARGFTPQYQPLPFANYPVPVDGWGNPIIIRWFVDSAPSTTVNQTHMVSAGPNGVLNSVAVNGLGQPFLNTYADFVADRQPGGARISDDDVVYFFFWPTLP